MINSKEGHSIGKYTVRQKREIVRTIIAHRGMVRRRDNRPLTMADIAEAVFSLPEKLSWWERINHFMERLGL